MSTVRNLDEFAKGAAALLESLYRDQIQYQSTRLVVDQVQRDKLYNLGFPILLEFGMAYEGRLKVGGLYQIYITVLGQAYLKAKNGSV